MLIEGGNFLIVLQELSFLKLSFNTADWDMHKTFTVFVDIC